MTCGRGRPCSSATAWAGSWPERTVRWSGFVNVLWDGLVHAWIQDTMVADSARHRGVATRLIEIARDGARDAGCEWLHVDFDRHLRPFYFDACGFAPTDAGLIELQEEPSEATMRMPGSSGSQRCGPRSTTTRRRRSWPRWTPCSPSSPKAARSRPTNVVPRSTRPGTPISRCRCTDRRSPRASRPGRRRQAVIQLASSLRNLGEVEESVALLTTERAAGSDELDDAVDAFLALSQADAGREREAVATALTALSRHMTRYRRSLSAYAEELADRG